MKMGVLPSDIFKKIGHFNVFKIDEFVGPEYPFPMPYSRKDYYKIALIKGGHRVDYADKSFEVKHNMLMFANPQVPYCWTPDANHHSGAFCVFTEEFVKRFGDIKDYPLYKPGGIPILDIDDEQAINFVSLFENMITEINGDYEYKYDVLRTLLFQMIHTALKLKPAVSYDKEDNSKSQERLVSLFVELLERQFPIESPRQHILFKKPGEFAGQLNVHVNHLNKVVKKITGKSTTEIINERIAIEARALLKHTNWDIAEIGWCLRFEDLSHFIKFFRKTSETTPKKFRTL